MSDTLTVHVNRDYLHSLGVADSYEVSDSFDVELVNHGGAAHVHLHLDDALAEQLTVEAKNHHVAGGAQRRVRVARTGDGTASGKLEVVAAHGATTRVVDVELGEPTDTGEAVPVGAESVSVDGEPGTVSAEPTVSDQSASSRLTARGRRVIAASVVGLLVLALLTGAVASNPLAGVAVGVLGGGGIVAAVAVDRVL